MLNLDTNAKSGMYVEKKKKKETHFTEKNWENEKIENMKNLEKKEKRALKECTPETAQNIDFFKRNVVRTREAIEAQKKIFSTQEKKKKRKT